jgi:Icc-related predicted phosphoesterase
VKITITSDTHGLHPHLGLIKKTDVLIHCGDCTNNAGRSALRDVALWLESQPHDHKILIAGNHDWAFEKWPELAVALLKEVAPSVTYLQDSGCEIDGIKFWGSPITPTFFDWAFNRARGEAIRKHWDKIPRDTQVLITHGPPKGVLDYNPYDKFHCGCEDLMDAVVEIAPRLHCFGHIHCAAGKTQMDSTTFVNASFVNEQYKPAFHPTVIEL